MAFNNNKVRILIFGHKEFSQLVSSVLDEFSARAECRIVDAIIGTIDEANAHIDVFSPDLVVSAGSNAAYLKASLDVPVLAMSVTETDIVSALETASKIANSIHLITYDDYSHLVSLLNQNTQLSITHSQYATALEAKETYYLAKLETNQAVVGASLVCGLAAQDNIKSFLIYSRASCRALIKKAIIEAQKQKDSIHLQAMQRWLFKDAKTPIIVVDNNTNILTSNAAAKTEFALQNDNQQHVIDVLHSNQFNNIVDGRCRLNNSDWFFHKDTLDLANRYFDVYQFYAQDPVLMQNTSGQSARPFDANQPLVYRSDIMAELIEQTDRYAQSPSHVLIIGESGTGKEMIARRIHEKSHFSQGKFVAINCAAMPSELFEGELFGYVEGAFTGSKRGGKHGLLYEAENGVLFLDEIGELSLPLQAKLLRVIQEKTYRPVGSHKEFSIKLKIVAATNRPLAKQVADGLFRNDLYYRLNVLSLHVPSLSARNQDLDLITRSKLQELNYAGLSTKQIDVLAKQLHPIFVAYHWPGNVRELENIIERLLAYCSASTEPEEIQVATLLSQLAPELFQLQSDLKQGALVENEIQLVNEAMIKFNGNKERVAQFLGISQTTLWRRLKRINDNNQRGQHHA